MTFTDGFIGENGIYFRIYRRSKTATVIADCTGTYLRWNGKDYKVCNPEKVLSIPGGTTVEASFKKITACNPSGNFPATCDMNHPYDSWIEVEQVK